MGRLTLHVLLSFAQFEREVTAERIRDKIAASKKKGMWMGGPVPLGYDVKDRRLVATRIEANTVNQIFRLYVELGTVRRLKDELDRLGIVTKRRVHTTGKQTGGKPFSRGKLYQLLSNPIYIGRIPHKGEAYPGEHDAIVELDTWQAVRNLLAQNAVGRTRKTNVRGSFLLTGKVFDENGDPLYLSQAHAHGRRYGYYISRHLMHGAHRNAEGWRIPARTLEHVVTASLSDLCRSESRLMDLMSPEEPGIAALTGLKARAAGLSAQLSNGPLEEQRGILHAMIQRIDLTPTSIVLILHKTALARLLDLPYPDDQSCVSVRVPVRLRRRGVETKMIIDSPDAGTCNVDPDLCRLIAQAHLWFDQLASGEACTVREIAGREKINEHEITRVLHLAFLSPRIVEDIFKGRQGGRRDRLSAETSVFPAIRLARTGRTARKSRIAFRRAPSGGSHSLATEKGHRRLLRAFDDFVSVPGFRPGSGHPKAPGTAHSARVPSLATVSNGKEWWAREESGSPTKSTA